MSDDAITLLAPLLLLLLIPIAGTFAMRDSITRRVPLLEIGVVYMSVVAIYGAIPLLNYLYHGLQISREADFRLIALNPSPADFVSMAWNQVLYLLCFTLAYVVIRGNHVAKVGSFARPEPRTMLVLVVLLVAVEVFFVWLHAAYVVDAPRNYADANKVARQYPLLLRQVANHLQGVEWTLKLMVMIWALMNYAKTKWIVATWIAVETAMMLTALGARQPFFVFIAMAATAYHLLVRPIPARWLVTGAVGTLVLFIIIGYARLGHEVSLEGGSGVQSAGVLESNNEFESLFTNALDVRRLREAGFGNDIQGALYFADIYKLIPQQLLPFDKVSPLEWYANSFYDYYVEWGGGFAFGAISEAMLGAGFIDLVWRGLVLGACYAFMHRLLICSERTSIVKLSSYIWLTVLSFLSYRDSTFAFIQGYFYRFLPVLVAIGITSAFSESRERPTMWAAQKDA